MDLGLHGKRAIVCAASKGLGKACAMALAEAGVAVVITGRARRRWKRRPRKFAPPPVLMVTAGRRRHRHAGRTRGRPCRLPGSGHSDQQCRRPAARRFPRFPEEMWHGGAGRQHAEPDRDDPRGARPDDRRRFGRIVNITSAAVKSPIPMLGLSNGARAGLTGFVAGLARDVAKHNVTINNLLPGPFRHRPAARHGGENGRGFGAQHR